MDNRNKSEKIFEQYLDSNGFQDKWTYEPSMPGKSRKPDYLLNYNDKRCFFEVKELRKKPNEPELPACIDPYASLRTEIDEVRKKFKEYKDYCCSLVVYNESDIPSKLYPINVFGAMLGDLGIKSDWNPNAGEGVEGSERSVFLKGGKMIDYKRRQPQNTTLSAIIVLEEFRDNIEIEKATNEEVKKKGRELTVLEDIDIAWEYHSTEVIRVRVFDNPFARIVFPEELFNGPFDERWRIQDDKFERAFVGNKLKELEALRESREDNYCA